MTVKTIFYKYKLECGHDAVASIVWYQKRDPKEPAAFHPGNLVKCQPCQYRLRKIVSESKNVMDE